MAIVGNISAVPPQNQVSALTPDVSSQNIGGLSFKDLLDAVNPLQHIPVVSGIYRAAAGDTISTVSKIAGDSIYGLAFGGGVLSVASSVADVAVKGVSGQDMGNHIVNTVSAAVSGDSPPVSLVATNTDAVPLLSVQPQTQASTVSLFAVDHNVAITAGQYHRAQILDTVNKALLKVSA